MQIAEHTEQTLSASLGSGLLTRGLDIQNQQKDSRHKHEQDTGNESKVVNFHN